MTTRTLAGIEVYPVGLGCMNLSHAYGTPPEEKQAIELLHKAVDLGVTHFDTAALYGFGKNETLLGKALKPYRQKIHLASKCAMTGVDGKRVIDGRPETLKQTIDEALQRLQTDVIDLYYLHRWDKNVPIEESMGAMVDILQAGKIKAIGLSEVSAATLKKAHAVYPIAAVQTEYSLWTRNAEVAVLEECKNLGAAFVAFSPLARGFLSGAVTSNTNWDKGDIRANMPRFKDPDFAKNIVLQQQFRELATESEHSMAQLCLAWLLQKADHIIPIPGTTSLEHLQENIAAATIELPVELTNKMDHIVNADTVSGPRYPAATQAEIDTEEIHAA